LIPILFPRRDVARSAQRGKASDDLTAVHGTIEIARENIASRNTSILREVIGAATRALDHLRKVDEALPDLLKALESKD